MKYRAQLVATFLLLGVAAAPAFAAPALPEPGGDADASLNGTVAAALSELYAVIQQNVPSREAAAVAAFIKSNGPSSVPSVIMGPDTVNAPGIVPTETLARLAAGAEMPAAPPAPQGGTVLVGSGAVSPGAVDAAVPAAAVSQVITPGTGNNTATQGPPPSVPAPPALFLLGSGLATLLSVRRPFRLFAAR